MSTITIKIDRTQFDQIKNSFTQNCFYNNKYIVFSYKENDFSFNIYKNQKSSLFSLVLNYLNDSDLYIFLKKFNLKIENNFIFDKEQIGSDEVGTGDFFGPVVVASSFVNDEIYKDVLKYKIIDSKKVKDEDILSKIPFFIEKYPSIFYSITLDNNRFNKAKNNGFNLNEIKAIMHNNCLYNLKKQFKNCQYIYIDEFVSKEKYFTYLDNSSIKNIVSNVIFHTKGETFYPAVALASCYARFIFLKEIDKINKKYNVKIPLGASSKVDEFAKDFIKKYSLDELKKISKISYNNFKKVI